MASDDVDDVLEQAAEAADEYVAKTELEAASDLIRDAFLFLPWQLQEGYWRVQELHNQHRRSEANAAWDEWMAEARSLGLI